MIFSFFFFLKIEIALVYIEGKKEKAHNLLEDSDFLTRCSCSLLPLFTIWHNRSQWHPWPLRDSGPGMRAAASSTAHHRPLIADSADGKFYILYYFIS